LILSFLGPVSLGYYGVTSLGGNALYGMLSQAGGAISVHISEDFGRNNDFAPALKKYLVKPTLIFSYIITGLFIVLLFFFLSFFFVFFYFTNIHSGLLYCFLLSYVVLH
jgi:hypothetical protein